jgi:Ig-like domain-containing protein
MRATRSCLPLSLLCLLSIVSCHRSAVEDEPVVGMRQPLASFRQVITSSTDKVEMKAGSETRLPLRIENPTTETWISAGKYPITISYKWYKGEEMLPIEGERTVFPAPLGPNQAVNVDVRLVAPQQPGEYTVRFTLVQEAVAWFMTKSNTFLKVAAVVK